MIQPQEVTRDTNQKKIIDIARIGHDTLLKEHQKVQDAVLGIHKFQAIPTADNANVVYQYDILKQMEYAEHEMVLISAISAFQPVIESLKQKLYRLEMQPNEAQLDTPATPPSPSNFFSRFKQPIKKRTITEDDPYQDELPYLREKRKKVGRFMIFAEYQSYGLSIVRRTSIIGQKAYLNFHRTRFRFEMAPAIVTTHREYVDLMLQAEKQGLVEIAVAKEKEWMQTRNDLPQPTI